MEDKDKCYIQNVALGLHGSFIYWNDRGGPLISIRGYEGAAEWLNPRVKSRGGKLKIAVCIELAQISPWSIADSHLVGGIAVCF